MFVDTAKVKLTAGKGGDGAVSFRHEIYIPKGGPDGGNGGRGGSIIFRADKNTNTLLDFRFTPDLKAEDGKNGSGSRSAGRSGQDLIINVPIGTLVYRLLTPAKSTTASSKDTPAKSTTKTMPQASTEVMTETPTKSFTKPPVKTSTTALAQSPTKTLLADLTQDGQTAVIARGGDGGFGNAHFKSSVRQTPRIAEVGEPGESFEAELELRLLADVGLVGLPNAGKSTLLSIISNATPKIADYPFTTLIPHLGVATIDDHDLLIADIPGLIAGASQGKGLGHAFLRHVDRTAVLLHLIDVYSPNAGQAYQTIRQELSAFSDLATRPEVVALTKCEHLDPDLIQLQINSIHAVNPAAHIIPISAPAHQGITTLLRALKTAVHSARAASNIPLADSASAVASSTATPTNHLDLTATPSARPTLPVITLTPRQLSSAWQVTKQPDNTFLVTGAKIEKFARRTDLDNYASLNRLRDIMKKLGIRAELTSQGATPDSQITIADKTFPLVEDY